MVCNPEIILFLGKETCFTRRLLAQAFALFKTHYATYSAGGRPPYHPCPEEFLSRQASQDVSVCTCVMEYPLVECKRALWGTLYPLVRAGRQGHGNGGA